MSTPRQKLKVLYIEDSQQSFDAISSWLKSLDYEVLPMVTSLQRALEMIGTEEPNILLVDLDLFEEGRDLKKVVDFIVDLRGSQPKLTILVHSAMSYIRTDIVRAIVAAGVSYLTKEATQSLEHLDRAIKHARTGGAVYDRHLVKFFDQIATDKNSSLLTQREWEVAALIAEEHLTNKKIAERLYISSPRVSELVSSILDKLGFSNRVEIATWYLKHKQ